MTNFDLKKLAKGMNLNDKMKLLFEDSNKQAETNGKESILTPQERDSIITDARRNDQIREIRRVNELYYLSNLIVIDLDVTYLTLLLAITSLEKQLMGIMLKGATEDIINEMIYDVVRENDDKTKNIEEKSEGLRRKYKIDDVLFKGFDFFELSNEGENNPLPNNRLELLFMQTFEHARKLKKKIFEIEYVIQKSPIDFSPEYNKNLINDCKELLNSFINLDQTLRPFRIYKDYGKAFINLAKLKDPLFLNTVGDLPNKIELTDIEKQELKDDIDKHIQKNL